MKRLLGLALFAVIGFYLWKNHFARLFQAKNQVTESLEEVRLKQQIGNDKRAAYLQNQIPFASVGDTPYAGVPLNAINYSVVSEPKELVLLPKGGNTSKNPFDRVINWLNCWIASLLLSAWGGTLFAAVPLPNLRQDIVYLENYQSNQLVSLAAKVSTRPRLIQLGPGVFTVAAEIDVAANTSIRGAGKGVTTIQGGGSAVLWPGDNSSIADLTIRSTGTIYPVEFFNDVTNVLFWNVRTQGQIDNYFFDAGRSKQGLICTIKSCEIISGWDAIFYQSDVSDALLNVEDTTFYMDGTTDGGLNPARALQPFACAGGGTIWANNLKITTTNGLTAGLFSFADTPIQGLRARFSNVSQFHTVTNAGLVQPYKFNATGGTNSFIEFFNCGELTVTTNAAIFTNTYGPQVVLLTGTAQPGLTNWLPDIAFLGRERYNFTVTIKDGRGTAAGTNISIRSAGGQTIDSFTAITITTNFGAVTLRPRPGTTNWMVTSRYGL
jgi:hypothetical protein